MKVFGTVLAAIATLTIASASFADDHAAGTCTDAHGKKIEAKNEADCKKAGGTWSHEAH